ncbi:DUF3488 domain-containing transglutaminase family protein [Comamonas piscis]|uniref:DUF3488 domain-containing transglutaminase family protein n=1 Tax=Comamonas piscis TaxID=1562974 RepID=A0A7G5EG78_9BURK|nr:DUF3488 and transglutaminase-like domain-containing protein [Comamonas piscis]QMV73003.1 DUF3488 domain-containing transglutaminase family protein [Comamonas piscis]WSO35786.1 DUF3488 and transglutaminase-like domain-containing protein [Comamonas piscis]
MSSVFSPTRPAGRARWTALPREARDTVFLLAVVGWVLLPLTATLPIWASALAYALLAWRGSIALRHKPLPGRWQLLALLVLVVGLTLLSYRTILGADAGVTLVCMLLTLKTMEMRAKRDAMVVFFLGFFALIANFLHSQSLLTALAIAIGLVGLLTALVHAHMPVGQPSIKFAAGLSLKMVAIGAPLTLALFVLFPRMAPLWGVPQNPTAKTGLSEEMTVGSVASLAQDEGIAFRVKFDTPQNRPPAANQLYWRGPVLSDFDGTTWRATPSFRTPDDKLFNDIATEGEPLRYELTLEPHHKPWLLTLDLTRSAPQLPRGRAYSTGDLQWLSNRPITEVTRIAVESHPRYRFGMHAGNRELAFNRRLPANSNPRTQAWVAQLMAEMGDRPDRHEQLVQRLQAQLRNGGYTYTLDPGVYTGQAADEFWFDRKQGFCEHISAAFVIALRSAGVPARIVTGYQGGESNSVDGYWTVRQADAHAWAEVWLGEEKGWVRYDPTGSVNPGRVGAAQRLNTPNFMGINVSNAATINGLQRMRAVWEAVNNSWNQWVLNYTQREQMDMLSKLGLSSPNWMDLVRILGGLVLAAALIVVLVLQYQRRRTDPWLALLTQARKRMRQAGMPDAALSNANTPRILARMVHAQAPDLAPAFGQWLKAMERQRYAHATGQAAPKAELAALRKQLRLLPWSRLRAQANKV